MTDNFIHNRIAEIEQLQKRFADEVKDRDSKGPQRVTLATTVIGLLESARQLLVDDAGEQ